MADSTEQIIIDVLTVWGEKLVEDLKKNINEVVTYESGQESDLAGSVNYKVLNDKGSITFQLSMNDYYKFVDKGRKKGVRGVPTEKIGKKWQNSHNINPSKIIQEITIKYNEKKGLKRKVKKLPFDKAAKSLAFLIQRAIKKNGIKPRPFMEKTISEQRINELKELLAPALAKKFILDIKQ